MILDRACLARQAPPEIVDRLALAELVADPSPRPFYIDADNLNAGHAASMAEAATSGRTWACNVAADVLAYDLDSAEHAAAGDRFAAVIAAADLPLLRTASGREGHRHLWAVIPDDAERARLTADAERLGLPKPRAVMRPPLAPHRLDMPVHALDDLDAFAATVETVRSPAHFDWRDILTTGRLTTGKDRSGSAMVWRICIGAIRDGHNLDTVRGWLADPSNVGGECYRRKSDDWLEKYVWPSAAIAAKRLPVADAADARTRLETIAAALEAAVWPGVGGATDRAIMLALLNRAHARGSMTPTMSYREIAEAAPCGLRTVQRSVQRLKAAGWLQTATKGRGCTETAADGTYTETAQATRWRLLLPDHCARSDHTASTAPPSYTLGVVTSRARLDVCRWGGLGLNTPRIIDALETGPLTARDLADKLGMNRRHVSARLLPRLAQFGLLVRSGDCWGLTDDVEQALEAAADELGLNGRAAAVSARHDADRVGYLDWREQTRPRRLQAECERRRRWLRHRRHRDHGQFDLDPVLVST